MIVNILIFIAVFAVLVIVHELGHFVVARFFGIRVDEFGVGFPPRLFSRKRGDTVYSINAVPLGGFVKIAGEDGDDQDTRKHNIDIHGENRGNLFSDKPIWQRVAVLCGGVFMNFLLGFLILIAVFSVGIPEHIVVSQVSQNSPASQAGIKSGDFLEGYSSVDDFISYVDAHKGEQISLQLNRGGKEVDVIATPRINPPSGQGALGVGLIEGQTKSVVWYRAIWDALKAAVAMFGLIFIMLFKLIASILTGGNLFSQIAGPVGIFQATTRAAGFGWVYLANIVALISLNLAALNIFPFPALDGGRIIFLIIEKIKGSPVSVRVQQWVNSVGFLLIIALLVAVTIQDIHRFF